MDFLRLNFRTSRTSRSPSPRTSSDLKEYRNNRRSFCFPFLPYPSIHPLCENGKLFVPFTESTQTAMPWPNEAAQNFFPPFHNIDRLAATAIQSQLSGKYISRLRFVAGHCSTISETGNPPLIPPFFAPFLIRSNWSLIPFLLACYLEPSLYREGERRLNPVGLIAEEGTGGGGQSARGTERQKGILRFCPPPPRAPPSSSGVEEV